MCTYTRTKSFLFFFMCTQKAQNRIFVVFFCSKSRFRLKMGGMIFFSFYQSLEPHISDFRPFIHILQNSCLKFDCCFTRRNKFHMGATRKPKMTKFFWGCSNFRALPKFLCKFKIAIKLILRSSNTF